MGLFKDGALVFMLERKNIEGRPAQDIAADLTAASRNTAPKEVGEGWGGSGGWRRLRRLSISLHDLP